ncbi:MAG: hypothetical protein ABS81_18570 [Pseudonocardia sp. SCN 72-86]|nr:MAG: hypothetical protein ABS81_18570 [Pseudonocardia sp. SCN 72-86]
MSGTGRAGEAEPQRGIAQSDTLGVAGTILGIAGVVGGLFMPLSAWALGLAAVVLGIIARTRGAGGAWIAAVVVGALAIACGIVVQLVVLNQ